MTPVRDEPRRAGSSGAGETRAPSLSIVVPVYNSAAIIPDLVAAVASLRSGTLRDLELVLVNDGSRDATLALLSELAVLTGGRSFQLRDARELEKTLATVARELRYQYLLGYTPAKAIERGEREWRSIKVVMKRPGLRVRARDGYMTE